VTPADPSAVPRRRTEGPARHKVLAALAVAVTLVVVVVVVIAVRGNGPGSPAALRPAAGKPITHRATSSPADAGRAAPPVVYSQVEGWHGGRVRPAAIYIGQGGSPYVTRLRWLRWTSGAALGVGYLHKLQPGCARPAYQCPYGRFRVRVRLSGVRTHGGSRFYARMRWAYTSDHVRYVVRWRAGGGYWRRQGRPSSHSALT
jgi:hypothetical protein